MSYTNEEMENKIKSLETKIKEIENEMAPNNIAKKIEGSHLSINTIRLWLQILAIIQTIFIAGAIAFGFVGVTNIMAIRSEAEKVKVARENIDRSVDQAIQTQKTIKKNADQVTNVAANIKNTTNKTIAEMQQKTKSSLKTMQAKLDQKLLDEKKQIDTVNSKLQDISQIFNKVAISSANILNPREQQLLVLLARDIDPENPSFNFNSGVLAANFGRYGEAITELNKAIKSPGLPPEIIAKAKQIKALCIQRKAHPPEIKGPPIGGAYINGYSILQLDVNILNTLWRNGYITHDEGQNIIDDAKMGAH